ncbi:dihydrofolate reductase family protein [Massilia sp. NR 4-1]|uniref:dihydrofolate reductase family protein n=1 Tax=Massilia sp. NR 4-1 TaxID=1678028 RepID=UPI00067BC243|nr:dihydrofolate reductase family protein [Massilia sp. NR 4-1]AKU22335.1 dihydrofolate reductase [Massilia sp. NR 4-1]
MRKIIAALQVSLDGFIEGVDGELDWIDTWDDSFGLMPQIDTCLLGGGMYPGYEQYWSAILASEDNAAGPGEADYARFAARTPHIVLSRTLERAAWSNTRIVRDIEDIRILKQLPGKDMHAVGGASLVASLMNRGLVDELRLVIRPVILGAGKALFSGVQERHALTLLGNRPAGANLVCLSYAVGAS